MIKILVTGDWHCGDKAGLTPPDSIHGDHGELQRQLWDWYYTLVKDEPFDMTLFTGDMVEGQNNKNTISLYEPDTYKQAQLAAECASVIKCKPENMFCVYGTPFHTAGTYSFEKVFTDLMGMEKPETIQRIKVGDLLNINVRHTVGRSSIPYGSGTPALKEMTFEMLHAEMQDSECADICIRGHVHMSTYHQIRDSAVITAPCLKYPKGIYGRGLIEGFYDMGIGILYVYGKKDYRYRPIHIPLNVSSKREWKEWNQGE